MRLCGSNEDCEKTDWRLNTPKCAEGPSSGPNSPENSVKKDEGVKSMELMKKAVGETESNEKPKTDTDERTDNDKSNLET